MPKRIILRPKGNTHDLTQLAAKVNNEFFKGKLKYFITYGRNTSHHIVRSRRLGAYRHADKLIIIHPILDAAHVPTYIVEFGIYHEMLHALQPPSQRRVHDRAFRQAEKRYPYYNEVQAWRKENQAYLFSGVAVCKR